MRKEKMSEKHRTLLIRALVLCLVVLSATTLLYLAFKPHQWEYAIQAFEKRDAQHPPKQGAVLFVGSSTIRLWETLQEDFPFVHAINRGFGGSQMDDLIHFADRIIFPYRPKVILIYEGDNDIYFGKSPPKVLEDFRVLVQMIQAELPQIHIAFLSIKPSPKRWKKVGAMKTANELIRQYCEQQQHLYYIDMFSPMLGHNGKPRPELYTEDELHLNLKGYQLWTQIITLFLQSLTTQ